MLLYYTGQRRLARNILRNVVGRYLDRDPALARIIDRLRAGAAETFAALREGDLRGLARGVLDFWSLKKEIDAGATNPALEALIARVSPMLDGYALPGAGGGGFLFMIARDDRAAARVRRVLSRRPPNALARFYDFEIDTRGLGVSVL
jgi:galactokinase/mevalonate kinase-like predicted kinase